MLRLAVFICLLALALSDKPRPPKLGDGREGKGSGKFGDNGESFKQSNKKGNEKFEFGLAKIIELTDEGVPVCGGGHMVSLGKNINMSKAEIMTEGVAEKGRFNMDRFNKSGKLPRRQGPGGNMPGGGRRRPMRQGKDETQEVDIPDDLEVESNTVTTRFNGGPNEPSFVAKLTAALVTSEGSSNFSIGSEVQIVKTDDVKFTAEISNFTFCGAGGRSCMCPNGSESVTGALKVCFLTKGSRSGKPERGNSSDDGLPRFDVEDAYVTFSLRFIKENESASEITEIPEDNIEGDEEEMDGKMVGLVCVTFEVDGDTSTIIYDPVSEVEEDDDNDDDDDSGSSATLSHAFLTLSLVMLSLGLFH